MKNPKLLHQIFSYHNWRHRVNLGNGLVTMGYNTLDNDWRFYGMPENLKGKSVLDIGANDGYYSFEAEKRGASSVTSIDIYSGDSSTMTGGWSLVGISLLKEYLNSDIEIIPLSVLALPELNKKWDVVFCNDVLSWLDDIEMALSILNNATIETLVIKDTFSTDFRARKLPLKIQHTKGYLQRMSLLYLKEKLKLNGFRTIHVKRIYSYKHFEWQYENFPSAESSGSVSIYDSPFDEKPIKKFEFNNLWVLMEYGDFYYIRTMGWVKKIDVIITQRPRKKWLLKVIKQCIPEIILDWYYGLRSIEKNTHEYRIIASRQ